VIDLSVNPQRCVLFNVDAVYLRHQRPDPDCQARPIGRNEAVQLDPLDFAALNVGTGTVITDIRKTHTSADLIAF
jgi:hypothetical protein